MALMGTVQLIVVVVVTATGWLPNARAEVTAEDKQAARRLLKLGKEHMAARRFQAALLQFKAAYRHWPRHEIQFNIAVVPLELGNRLAAAIALHRYLKRAGPAARKALVTPMKKLLRKVAVRIHHC